MDNIAETSILFDIYGGLLTDKKKKVMELYHEENLSLSEIAEEQGISRAAVHDALRSAENSLRDYEARLNIACEYRKRRALVNDLRNALAKILESEESSDKDRQSIEQIEEILTCLEE